MTTRKDLIIAVLATFCLTSTLFMIIPTKSTTGIGEYDPWVDIDGDGEITIYDVVGVTKSYAATGDPTRNVNVTNWPTNQNVDITHRYYEWYVPNFIIMNYTNPIWDSGFLSTEGYGRFTVGVEANLTVKVHVSTYIGWMYFAVDQFFVNTLTTELRTYEVQGHMIIVQVATASFDYENNTQAYVGISMTT